MGMISSVAYHFRCQYPGQVDVSTLFILLCNSEYWFFRGLCVQRNKSVVSLYLSSYSSIQFGHCMGRLEITLTLRLLSLLCGILFTTFTSITLEFRPSLNSVPLIGACGNIARMAHYILRLDKCIENLVQSFNSLIEGPIVRIGPNHISFNSLKAIEDIHGTKTKARKGLMYDTVMTLTGLPSSISNSTLTVTWFL